jgi:hypothetical protein
VNTYTKAVAAAALTWGGARYAARVKSSTAVVLAISAFAISYFLDRAADANGGATPQLPPSALTPAIAPTIAAETVP